MRSINMRNLFNNKSMKIDCIYCEKINTDFTGWTSLCNQTCYYGICNLLDKYNNGEVSVPDPRIIKFFYTLSNAPNNFTL
jgi:hypothetical protein